MFNTFTLALFKLFIIIIIRYGLDGPGIESRWWGEIFRTRPDRPCGPPSLLYAGFWISFSGVKRPGRGVKLPPSSSAEVKERVELYLYSTFGPSWPLLERNLPIIIIIIITLTLN